MALQAADFIRPTGRLREEHFPGDDLETLVNAWITRAETKTAGLSLGADEEAAQKAWVYHLAYSDIADRLFYNPSTIDVEGEGSAQTLVSQMQDARDKADAHAEEFEQLTEEEETATAPRSTTTQSQSKWI